MYRLIRPLLFSLPPETAHSVTLGGLNLAHRVGLLSSLTAETSAESIELMGLRFPNRIGLAAGLDKNGTNIDSLGALGFGFVEIGTVTPFPQSGNGRPRLFRLVEDRALINRMGFPNRGVKSVVERLRARTFTGICGVNIGKNASTALANAADDYVACLNAVYNECDYVTVNISSPNTAELRDLQHGGRLRALLSTLAGSRRLLADRFGKHVPIVVKLTADLSAEELEDATQIVVESGMDGIVATNTTTRRENLKSRYATEEGGLSGEPLRACALAAVDVIRRSAGAKFPVIGAGGVSSAHDAAALRAAGADLVQIYTGLIYRGPRLLKECLSV